MPILENLVYSHLTLQVRSAASLSIEAGKPGIHCVGFPAVDGGPALVVIWDDDAGNEGASATNSIETVLGYLQRHWAGVVPVDAALVVQRDSMGSFDHAYPIWRGSRLFGAPAVGWKPLRWPDAAPRSWEAFHAMFGIRAQVTLDIARNATIP